MGRSKKAGGGAASQKELKPFCYYCDRTFNDEIVLLQHQRGKHFHCPECDHNAIRGKCESIQGLIVHTLKIHGKTLSRVPNAMQGRDNPSSNVFGMDGIPESILAEKGYPLPGIPDPKDNQTPPAPSAAPAATAGGMSAVAPGMPALAAIAGMPGLPPLPGMESGGGGVSDFLAFLGKQQQPGAATPSASGIAPPLPTAQPGPPAGSLPMGMPPGGAMPMGMPPGGAVPMFSVPGLPGLGRMPGAMPVVTGLAPQVSQAQGVKRPMQTFEEVDDEDISVEERRACLDRYRVPAGLAY